MKKQFFNMLLSAAIFTTSPLFAMDRPSKSQDPFYDAYQNHGFAKKVEITPEQLKSMSSKTCSSNNLVAKIFLDKSFNIATYGFLLEKQPYELHVFSSKSVSPEKRLESLIETGKTVEFSKEFGTIDSMHDIVAPLPIAFYYREPDFHMVVRTKY